MLHVSPTRQIKLAGFVLLLPVIVVFSCAERPCNERVEAAIVEEEAHNAAVEANSDPYANVNTVAQDRSVWQQLLSDHREIVRAVTYTPSGVEATTETLDPRVRARIIDHAQAMQHRMKAGAKVRVWDPVFADLFDEHEAVKLRVDQIERGVKIVESSNDADTVALLWSHAAGVSEFVREGHDAGRRATRRIETSSVVPASEVAIGGVRHRILLGQPTAAQLDWLKTTGANTVLNLRKPEEHPEYDERAAADAAGLEYCGLPYQTLDELTDDVFDSARERLREADKTRVTIVLHCRTGNRVGPLWAAYRVLDCGVPMERALFEARSMRMVTPGAEERIRAYVASRTGSQN